MVSSGRNGTKEWVRAAQAAQHCKYLNGRFECNDNVISVYSHYPFDQNAKTFDTKGKTFSIR